MTINLQGEKNYKGLLDLDSDQNFAKGEKVVVFGYNDTHGNEWNTARKLENDDIEMCKKAHPSYSYAGLTHYLVGIKTVTRIFTQKMWVK